MTERDPRRRRFHLRQRIGQGAYGEVYLAEQDSGAGFRRPVALKILNEKLAGSEDAARRMRDEARILGRLSHRNIVGVLDLVRIDDQWAVVMDYVAGADLEQVLHALELTDGEFPVPAAFEVGAAVCRALDAAWSSDDGQGGQLQCIHRDIKPSNIRVTADGEVKVVDFGVARVELETREARTRGSAWIGTERYMAPERILMDGDTRAGDVYATAASVLELLLGRPLGRTPVLAERHTPFVDEALEEARPRLEGPAASIEQAISSLRAALEVDPAARPSAGELAGTFATLARRLEGEHLAAFTSRFVPRVGELIGYHAVPVEGTLTEGSTGDRVEPDQQATRTLLPAAASSSGPSYSPWADDETAGATTTTGPSSRRVGLVLALLLLGVVVAGGAAWWLLGDRDPQAPVDAGGPAASEAPVDAGGPASSEAPGDAGATADRGTLDDQGTAEAAPAGEPSDAPGAPGTADAPDETASHAPALAPAPRPAPAPQPAPATTEPAPDAPRVSRALVFLPNASALQVSCGDRSASGTASVRIRDFPAGACTVRANFVGEWLEDEVTVERPREVPCAVDRGTLRCE